MITIWFSIFPSVYIINYWRYFITIKIYMKEKITRGDRSVYKMGRTKKIKHQRERKMTNGQDSSTLIDKLLGIAVQ